MYGLGQYYPQASLVHSLDPRVKILAVLMLSIIILQVGITGLAAATGLILLAAIAARLHMRTWFRTLRPVIPFFICLFILYIFFTPGRPLPGFPLGPIAMTFEGLFTGLVQTGKFALLILAAALLTMTTTQLDLTIGLERMLRPVKIVGLSSHEIALMISLALRFLPMLEEEMNTIKESQLARGADFNAGSIGQKMRFINYLAVPLVVSTFRRCDDLIDAMESRGYQPGSRTYLRELTFRPLDYGLLTALAAALITAIWL